MLSTKIFSITQVIAKTVNSKKDNDDEEEEETVTEIKSEFS